MCTTNIKATIGETSNARKAIRRLPIEKAIANAKTQIEQNKRIMLDPKSNTYTKQRASLKIAELSEKLLKLNEELAELG